MNIVLQTIIIILQLIVNVLQIMLHIVMANARINQSPNLKKKNAIQRYVMQCLICALIIPILLIVNTKLMKLHPAVTIAWIVPLDMRDLVDLNTIIVSPIFAKKFTIFALELSMNLRNVVLLQIKFLIAALQLAMCAWIAIDLPSSVLVVVG
jgi:hypothetical protein